MKGSLSTDGPTKGDVKDLESSSKSVADFTTTSRYRRSKIAAVLISGVGFLADAYDLFVIDFVVAILVSTAVVKPTVGEKGLIVSATLAGAVIGQLGFGVAADFVGRRIMFITTAMLVICGSVASALVGQGYTTSVGAISVFQQLAICRFLLGIGIGGEYPLSATVAAENETMEELTRMTTSSSSELEEDGMRGGKRRRNLVWYLSHKPNSIAAVFSMQGVGMLLSPLFVILCIAVGISLETTWRFCLGIGALPSAVAFVFRWRMHETAAFRQSQRDYSGTESVTTDITAVYSRTAMNQPAPDKSEASEYSIVIHDAAPATPEGTKGYDGTPPQNPRKANKRGKGLSAFGKHLQRSWQILKKYRYVLLGTSATWFLIDVTLYGTGSFKSAVVGKWFLEEPTVTPAMYSEAPQRLLGSEVLRPLEFPQSRAQTQRDYVRVLLHSLLDTTGEQQQYSNATLPVEDHSGVPHKRLLSAMTDGLRRRLDTRAETVSEEERRKLMLQAQMSTIVALMAIPGYFLSLFLIDRTGTKPLQLWGFVAVAVVFVALGIEQLFGGGLQALELILFGLTFLCSNFGPNTTTFILPAQLYPTLVRATCHGFSAAMGKLGGVVGTSFFSVLERDIGMGWLLIICGIVAVLGVGFTLLIPADEAARKQLISDQMELVQLQKRERDLQQQKNCIDESKTQHSPVASPCIAKSEA